MQIKHLAQGHNILLPGFEPSTSVSRNQHSSQTTNMLELTANMLNLNDNKTELMLITSKKTKQIDHLPTSITIGNAQIPFKQSVKSFGFTLDGHHSMNAHVSNIARTCYFELRRLASICRFKTSRSILVVWLECRFLDTEVDGSNPGNSMLCP